jgi:hypothetical protein
VTAVLRRRSSLGLRQPSRLASGPWWTRLWVSLTRPEARALVKHRSESDKDGLPGSQCLPNTIPLTPLILPFKIIQTPQQIVMLLEHYGPPRQIYMDGRCRSDMPRASDRATHL